jgi:hypothetical protein
MAVIWVRQQQVVQVLVVKIGGRRDGLHGREIADVDRGPNGPGRVLCDCRHRAPRGPEDVVCRGYQGRGRQRG